MAARKKKDLSAVLQQAKEGMDEAPAQTAVAAPVEPESKPDPIVAAPVTEADARRASTRQGKKAVITYLPPDVHTELKILAARRGTTIQELSEQAFDLLFKEYAG